MRGIETGKVRIRHEVFTEIARMAYEGGDYAKRLEATRSSAPRARSSKVVFSYVVSSPLQLCLHTPGLPIFPNGRPYFYLLLYQLLR